uniref:Trimethylguanosine synthase n=1 Tax=Lupinus angustifolius TaxID=3871 RepID=A0A8F6YHJ2_LUPAN|nr:trimethylguanosine synthase 1-like protein [Lupinus angustifolius]
MVIADTDYEGAAIESLGSGFKVTQVFLWSVTHPSLYLNTKLGFIYLQQQNNSGKDFHDLILPVDLELTRQMNELGLPLSFQTTKEKSGPVKGKRRGTRSKIPRTCHNHVDEALYKMSVEEIVSAEFHDKTNSSLSCISTLGQSELSNCDGAMEVDMTQCVFGEGDNLACFSGVANGVSMEKNNDDINDATTNNVQRDDVLVSNVCVDLSISPTSETVISAGSHLAGAGVDYSRVEYGESLEFLEVASKDTGCETICNDDSAATWQPQANESESIPMSSEGIRCDRIDASNNCGELRDWTVFWDTFYMRSYFYNVKTNTSTWNPPPGMEHLAVGGCIESDDSEHLKAAEDCETENNTKLPEETLIEENLEGMQYDEASAGIGVAVGNMVSDITRHSKDQSLDHSEEYLDRSSCNDGISCCSISNTTEHTISYKERCIQATSDDNNAHSENMNIDVSGLETESNPVMSKQEKKVKRRQRQKKLYDETKEMPEEYPATIEKYWWQRYILFSRFDDGVKMDEEGWFSVTPETIARYQTERCASGTIIDCFTGVGGNAIQFAQWCKHVIAIDIDPLKIDYARHNAAIYEVDDQIDFIMSDFFLLAPKLKADTVFLSPPWGGPDYTKVKTYDMKTMLRPHDGYTLFNAAKEIASKVVMFLPRNVDFNQLAELALSSCPPWSLEVEKVYLNGKLKAITAYFSDAAIGGPLPSANKHIRFCYDDE